MEWFIWLVFGSIIGGLIVSFVNYLNKIGVQLIWFEWLLFGLGTLLIVFGVETLVHSLAEFQPQAGWMGLLFMSVPAIIMFVVIGRSVKARMSN
ncbi:MAG: hypothetical protein GY755_13330 [Chloroflexi bacterium]|nr:hypothetical protein [Chloroflexota bacterium]